MRYQMAVLAFSVLLIAILLTSVEGEAHPDGLDDNIVYLLYDHEDTEITIYIGEERIDLFVYIGLNTSSYIVRATSPLIADWSFVEPQTSWYFDQYIHYGLQLLDGSPPGKYLLTANLNYSLMDGTIVERVFEFTVDYVLAWETKDFLISEDQRLVLIIETYIDMGWVSVEFTSSKGLRLEEYEFWVSPVEPGVHRFETGFITDGRLPALTDSTFGYNATAHTDLATRIYLGELDVPGEDLANKQNVSLMSYLILGSVIVITVVVIIFIMRIRKKKVPEGPEEGGAIDGGG